MNETTDATALFAPLWRRKWLILIVAIVVAAGSYEYYKRERSVYSSSTEVYLGNGAEEQSQIGVSGGGVKKPSTPNPATQSTLINSSIIKELVRQRLKKERKSPAVRAAQKGKVKAKNAEKSLFISISGEAGNAKGVALLVNTTAQVYVRRQNAKYLREVEAAISLTRRQLRRVEPPPTTTTTSKGKTSKSSTKASATIQVATLDSKINELESDLTIQQVKQVNPAKPRGSTLVSPHPKSNAIFGFVIGLLLAALGAYLLDRLDRRVRSLAAIEAIFQAQILTALQAVKRPLLSRDGHPVPAKSLREALWRLQTTIQTAEPPPRVILCVSADAGDGRSTLAGAFALVLAEAGERVALVEADFRRPVQGRLLALDASRGLADVLTGRLTAEEAMQAVNLASPEVHSNGTSDAEPTVLETAGSMSVLLGAAGVANPPALLARPAMGELLRSLGEDFDHVIVDAPAPLQVSDAISLLTAVDGIVIVARIGHTAERSAQRLAALLARTPSAPVLGVVANGVKQTDVKKYGFAAPQYKRGWRQTLIRR
ncbi:MAG TPA: Wzz/FepE/Etk N-terminal domain-containing protein [Solirubrobacteraceae bacterium]|nr:Wzz/FepE/Etk N-terminal domain-containing protein [Solirubrobacteraceae bacterium]